MSTPAHRWLAFLVLSTLGVLGGTVSTIGAEAASVNSALAGPQVRFLTPSELPAADQGSPYSVTLRAVGGSVDPTYAVSQGSLPDGLVLADTGEISGVPTVLGAASFSVTATAAGSQLEPVTQPFSLEVSPAGTCMGVAATIVGTSGDDIMVGTPGDDVITALYGNDQIQGGGGNDTICGGFGVDAVVGGPGADILIGGPGADDMHGGPGDDDIRGQAEADILFGEEGADSLRGGADADTCSGGVGNKDSAQLCENLTAVP